MLQNKWIPVLLLLCRTPTAPPRVDMNSLRMLSLTVFIALIVRSNEQASEASGLGQNSGLAFFFRILFKHPMEETLRQLGELLLGAVPTVILLALLYALYATIVHKPLRRVLDERRSKTEGAVEKSRADIAAAEARTTEYEQRLREARATVFRAQEARRKAALDARTAALHQAREQAQAQVQAAKADIENDREAAQTGLQAQAQMLATEIMRRVLEPAGAGR